ncbi:MAG: amidohydrolase family protein [Pseudomonadota bacterium]|mgnify:FL=1|jgi:predicted TIM-barrel fold metal-dependent hydrolase|nr:amidohydrolase family protein [Pseudomonadota bacterium]MED6343573.1 amidohydrolase family protein [Pseudomonadota bacterium]|tara:strand:- start:3 stop:857 length:855 start_codon:yes stop_codon:yes gene_type:complete
MSGIIDIVVNLYTPQEVELGQTGLDEEFKKQVRMPEKMRSGVTIPDYIKKMDQAGIERSLLIAVRAGDIRVPESFEVPYESVHKVCSEYPDRFSGLAGIDPFRGMQGLRDLENAVNEMGFVGAHLYPHWCELPPNHRKYYPYYAKCSELGIPIMMQVGHNLVYSRKRRLPSVGKPIYLDQVAIDFPELKLIGIHIGIPWTEEMISMCWKHENVFTAGDAYAPKYWPESYVHYANSYGQKKVLFGTDWPVIDPVRAVEEFNQLNFRESASQRILRENALEVFNLS